MNYWNLTSKSASFDFGLEPLPYVFHLYVFDTQSVYFPAYTFFSISYYWGLLEVSQSCIGKLRLSLKEAKRLNTYVM